MRKKDTERWDLHALPCQSVITLTLTISPQVSVAPTTTITATVTGSIRRETQHTRSHKLHNRYVSTKPTKPLPISCLSNQAKTTASTNLDSKSGIKRFQITVIATTSSMRLFKKQHLQKHTSYFHTRRTLRVELIFYLWSQWFSTPWVQTVTYLVWHLIIFFFFFPLSSRRP